MSFATRATIVILTSAALAALLPAAPGPEGAAIVAKHSIVFNAPVGGPTKFMPSGPLLGNGDIGVMQSGPAEELVFYIGKNDFWGIRTQAPMAVGQLRLLTPDLHGANYEVTEDMRLAEIRGHYAKGRVALASRAWVDANQNLFCIELANKGTTALPISVRNIKGSGSSQVVGTSGDSGSAFLYDPDAPNPEGRKIAWCGRVVGGRTGGLTLEPGQTVVVATAILSDLDAKGKDPLAEARALVDALTPVKLAELTESHRQWWHSFWSRSFIEIPDKEIEQCWYSSWYIMASCSRAGKVAPGLWGNWITVDNSAWHGDFHLNYNFQAPFYGLYSANHAETTLPFYDAMNQSIARGRRIAQKHGWRGIHLPVSIGPWGMCPEGDDSDWGQRSNTAYAALPYLWYWQYTQDKEWLRSIGYSYVREVAAFWEDYLKLENGPDGKPRYVIHNDSIHEGSGPDMNPILSLGLVRALFKGIIPMSEALGVDSDKRAKWTDIVAKISDFPLQEKNGKTIFRYSEKGMAWNGGNTLGIQHIFPAGAIGLDSEPKLVEISRNMIDAMARWRDYNGSSSWYTACARVGYDPRKILAELHTMYAGHALPNKLLNFGGGGIENVSPALGITEMLLQSHEGVLRLFPCWPREVDARFGDLRACGAFLVSAELKDGAVAGVRIISEKGRDCAIVNPWPGKSVRTVRSGKAVEILTGDRLTLRTTPNETIALEAEGAR